MVADNLMNLVRVSLLLAVALLPPRLAAPLQRLERYGLIIVVVVFFVLPLLGLGIDPFDWIVSPIIEPIYNSLRFVPGH